MAKIDRYDGNLKAFAADALGSERTIFGDTAQSNTLDANITSDLFRGWGIVGVNENPTKQDFNGLGFTLGQLLSYLHQAGVAEWNGTQEYFNGSIVNRLGSVYRCLTAVHVSATVPENDPTNWRFLAGGQTITGSTTFTQSTNNIALPGIGSIGLEIGDVVEVTGTADNNKLFTVEVITDSGNVIVNQAHAGGTTSKSLVDETVSATVTLLTKWYNAPIGLGQGPVEVSRAVLVSYTNSTNRAFSAAAGLTWSSGPSTTTLIAEGVILDALTFSALGAGTATLKGIIPAGAAYGTNNGSGHSVVRWVEVR